MGSEGLAEQFDALLRPSKGMRFVVAYTWVQIGVLLLGSLLVLRVAIVSGEWMIAVPVPLAFILTFMFFNTVKGLQARYQTARRDVATLFWVCGAFSFILGVLLVAKSIANFDVDDMWKSAGVTLLSVLWVAFAACNIFCAIYLEESEGAHAYFGGKPLREPTKPRYVQKGASYSRTSPFRSPYR